MSLVHPSGEDIIGTEALARLIGVSSAKVRDLNARGIITKLEGGRNYNLLDAVNSYTAHIRDAASGRNHTVDMQAAKLAKAKADANKATMAARMMAGDLIAAKDIESEWLATARITRAALMAAPSRIANRLNLDNSAKAIVAEEIEQTLTDLADGKGADNADRD
jgi:phage terminase Nu1 subunit (DNA packaging protein)